jgi:hypothetical protein
MTVASDYTWAVTGQTQDTQFDGQGNQTQGKQISFTVQPSGYTGTLFVSDAMYANPQTVREALQREVDAVMAVHTLNG